MKTVGSVIIALFTVCAAMAQTSAPADTIASPPQFHRSQRPIGFKLGFAGIDHLSGLGVGADVIISNRIGAELASTIAQTSCRVRCYLLEGSASPYVGIGTGIGYNFGEYLGSWKEFHAGFEQAFANGLLLQIQFFSFFDTRGVYDHANWTLSPSVGFRL